MNCSGLIDKPKNLVPEDEMSELIAEFAINEQTIPIAPNTDLESSTRFLLKQKKYLLQIFRKVINITLQRGN